MDGPLGPFAVDRARRLTDERLYSGRLVRDRAGKWNLLAFRNAVDGAFAGELSDPMPVVWEGDRLVVPDLTPADAAGSR